MKKVAVILARGFEEIEAISVIDILRRAGVQALAVGLDELNVIGSHEISIQADMLLKDLRVSEFEMIVLPGGLPGAEFLAKSEMLGKILRDFDANNAKIAAICAAPWALATSDVLKSSYTCYPGFEKQVAHDGYKNADLIVDQNIITSKGPATAMKFALELVKELCGQEKYQEVKSGLLFKD